MPDATVVTSRDRFHAVAAEALPDASVPVEVQTEVADPYDAYRRARRERDVVMGVRHAQKPHVGVQFHPESILTEHGKPMVQNFLDYCRRWER